MEVSEHGRSPELPRRQAERPGLTGGLFEENLDQLTQAVDVLGSLADDLTKAEPSRRLAAIEAARLRRRYRELFDLAPDGYLVTDTSGVILEANRAASEMLGVESTRLEGKPLMHYFAEGDRANFQSQFGQLKGTGEVAEWEAMLRPRHADPHPVLLRVGASLAEPDAVMRVLLYDLTSRRRVEQQEKAVLKETADRARSLERTKSNFLRLASHELRGPLALVRGYLSMMGEGALGNLPPGAVKVMPIIFARVDEIGRMIEDMLEAARLEDGRVRLRMDEVDLAAACRSAAGRMRLYAGPSYRITVKKSVPTLVRGDARRVSTILTNLLDNAVKYQPGGGRVVVSVMAADGHAIVEVADRGIGITDEQLETLFKPFGRVVTPETSHIPGTGLGLYLCRELARLQGGELELVSQKGKGTRARLHLPLATASKPKSRRRKKAT